MKKIIPDMNSKAFDSYLAELEKDVIETEKIVYGDEYKPAKYKEVYEFHNEGLYIDLSSVIPDEEEYINVILSALKKCADNEWHFNSEEIENVIENSFVAGVSYGISLAILGNSDVRDYTQEEIINLSRDILKDWFGKEITHDSK